VLGAGIANDLPNIRAEFAAAGVPFEGRVGRMMEGLRLCRELWTGKPVDWTGRWPVNSGVLAPTPYRSSGPPIWMAGSVDAAIERAGKYFDGWFSIEPSLARWSEQLTRIRQIVREAGRDIGAFAAAMYVTVAVDQDASRAEQRIDAFLENYYGQPASVIRQRQACYGGPAAGLADFLRGYVKAGATHIIVRLVGDPDRQLEIMAGFRAQLDG
jgi:alkanesulfonate monooxygenase SsuD/methylene tetrahydromethanopterin reductase-like flavin-dependent oxidoreductase (luciferase family)